jgi:hypothetical protein
MRYRVNYQEVSMKARKTWKDLETGKKRQETKKFFQYMSEFNMNENRVPKNRSEIYKELNEEIDKWLEEPPEEGVTNWTRS